MASERFVRWQGYTINQLTFALNLFLGLSVGALAFGITLFRDEKFIIIGCPKLAFSLGLITICISFVAGCLAVVSRLLDFRFTARKIRSDEKGDPDNESGVYKYRTKLLGQVTWRLFWTQVISFFLGLTGLAIGLFSFYG